MTAREALLAVFSDKFTTRDERVVAATRVVCSIYVGLTQLKKTAELIRLTTQDSKTVDEAVSSLADYSLSGTLEKINNTAVADHESGTAACWARTLAQDLLNRVV